MKRLSTTVAFVVALLSASPAWPTTAPAGPPNILLIVIDTLRADRVGAYGNERGLTPFLDSLASRGVVFSNAYAASSWTSPSIASLFTSRYPSQHRVASFKSMLAAEEVTLGERLAAAGYRSAGFTANLRLAKKLGFSQGFDHWRVFFAKKPHVKPRAARVRGAALAWLDSELEKYPARPRLLYLHFMEPHPPLHPPARFKRRFAPQAGEANDGANVDEANEKLTGLRHRELSDEEVELLRSLYDAEVAAIDEELRLIFEELETRGFLRNAVVVVTSDHGTELREHGGFLHGFTMYNETIKVPLFLMAPALQGGRVVQANVSLVDVAPTILELAGLPPEPRHAGRSLASLVGQVEGKAAAQTDVVSQLLEAGRKFDVRKHRACIIRDSKKLAVRPNGTTQLFDLHKDPGEQDPNPPSLSSEAAALKTALDQADREYSSTGSENTEVQPLDEAVKDRLRALGYMLDGTP